MKKSLLTLVMAFVASVMAMAQVTTSSLAGIVTDDMGEVVGATVQAIHTPSGTHYGTITNDKGAFAIRGMRVGGPYEIIVSYVGAQTQKFEDVTLALGETFNLNVKLSENADVLGEVVVVGSGSKFAHAQTGAATNINSSALTNMPTVSRSITEFTRLSPYGGNGMSFGGADGRTANFTIDGANFNNNFGLSSNLPGGGNPVSIDAIEEMQVVISPYDVRQTGFVGGGVNAITKSGTNEFKGSAYVYHKNENMRGDAIEREQILNTREKDQQTTWGFTLGGPIIKNKLFFFANAEWIKTPTIANRWRGSEITNGVAGQMNPGVADPDNYISRSSNFDLKQVSDFIKSKYGYDTGSWTSFPADETNVKYLFRLDWNINDNHHLAVRYNYTENEAWNAPNASSMDGGTRASGARTSQYSMSYANSMYSVRNVVNSATLDLNSRFSDKLSNQFLFTFSKLDDVRGSNSSEFPFIDILDGNGQNYIALGYELFTYNNAVHNTHMQFKDDVTYYLGNHKLTAGLMYEYQMADNMYMRNGTGYYRYKSLEDFLSSAAPEIVNLTYGYNGETDPAARVTFNKAGLYLQDEWTINEKFLLNYGLRIDGLFFDNSDLMTNKALLDEDYLGKHFDTGKWPGSNFTFAPRVGFSYDVLGDKSLKVRGGTGFFQGRLPLVFFTNMPTNSGMIQYNAQVNEKNASKNGFTMDKFAGDIITDKNKLQETLIGLGYPKTISPDQGALSSGMCAVDPDFKLPLVWKTSVAVDYSLPTDFPLSVSAEGIYTKNIYETTIRDYAVPDVNGFARFNGADNRPIFPDNFTGGKKNLYVLENTTKGYGFQSSVTVKAEPTRNISLMAAYTHTVKKEITSLPGSNASSVLNYVSTVEGPNSMKLHNGANVTPDRFIANATFHDKANNHYSIIYETWRGGNAYSYEMTNDMNGDGFNYDAMYIPTDEEVANGMFRFVDKDSETRFMDYVHNNSYLKDHQGEYAEPYSVYSPWVHRVDFSYKHDFKFNIANTEHKIQLSADIKNLLNLFNSKWGVSKIANTNFTGSSSDIRVLTYEGVDEQGYATFSTPKGISGDTKMWGRNHAIGQCWYMSIGIKYIFN
ncbi:MAG: TonB-dependent receptor [Bacteroidales bacterium]|nr:TonB-dependent receptor [Bacteroidales bacterium]